MKTAARDLLLFLGDVGMLLAAFFIMLALAFPTISGEALRSHVVPFSFVFIIWIFIFALFNLYKTEAVKPTIPNLRRIGIASMVALTASIIMFYAVASFGITPKTNLLIFSLTFVALFILWRRVFYSIFSVYFRKSLALIVDIQKDSSYIKELVNYIESYPQSGFSLVGTYTSLKDFYDKHEPKQIDTLIVSKNILKDGQDMKLIYSNIENILDLAYAYETILGKIPVDSIDETWFLYNIRGAGKSFQDKITRLLNIIIALLVLIVSSPIILVTALAVKFGDGHSIFYNQLRIGKNGKIFKLYKFRSMIEGADKNGAEWTEKNDPRITGVGRVIRKLHLDEIPQLLNVLRGDMSLVGPRPEIPSFDEKLAKEIPHYNLRHIITPGFTGWAQIKWRNARGVEESKHKFEYDLYYIKNRNIFMDFGILLRTIMIIFTHDA